MPPQAAAGTCPTGRGRDGQKHGDGAHIAPYGHEHRTPPAQNITQARRPQERIPCRTSAPRHPYAAHRRASPGDGERANNDRAQFNSMRRLLRDIAENREPDDVTTLRDASVLTQLQQNAAAGERW